MRFAWYNSGDMTATLIRESVTEAPVKSGNRWKVIVARPGKGSSGTYSEELFRRDAEKIIAPGGHAFINHDDKRNPKDLLGTYPEGARWSEEDSAVVAELEVFSHWKSFVEEVGPHCGISLYALGEQDDEGNVTSFIEDAQNGADLVARPGLVGSGIAEKLYESAISHSVKEPTTESSVGELKETDMDEIKELTAVVSALATKVETLVSAQEAKAVEEAQLKVDTEAVEKAIEAYAAQDAAITAAELLPTQANALRAEAKRGVDVAPLLGQKIKERDEMIEEATKRLGESKDPEGRIVGSLTEVHFTGFGGK